MLLAAVIGIFKYDFIANSIDIHYLNKTFSLEKLIVLPHRFAVFVCCCFAKRICPSQGHLFQPTGNMLLVKRSYAVSSHRKFKKLQLIIMRKTKTKLPAACCWLGVAACGPGKVRDRGTGIYAPVSMVTGAWFWWSVYYRKVMTHITQWGFLHHFYIRVLENQRHVNYLVNSHRQYF